MTDEEMTEIERRANAATEGPWFRKEGPWKTIVSIRCQSGEQVFDSTVYNNEHSQNVDFITHAREDISKLIAEIRHLRRRA